MTTKKNTKQTIEEFPAIQTFLAAVMSIIVLVVIQSSKVVPDSGAILVATMLYVILLSIAPICVAFFRKSVHREYIYWISIFGMCVPTFLYAGLLLWAFLDKPDKNIKSTKKTTKEPKNTKNFGWQDWD